MNIISANRPKSASSHSSHDPYLITDPPLRALWIFAIPMILGSLFQQVYNMADSVIVGRFVGQNALAAVGASSALTTVFICVAVGSGVGASVLVSRYFGGGDYTHMRLSVSTSMVFFLLLSIVLGAFGVFTSRGIMVLLNTPAEVLPDAVTYLQVYFLGFPFLFMYNILSSMFNAIGNSRVPLFLLIFSSILNIFLDVWMVASLHLGVFGAALATLISQGISAIFSFLLFLRQMRRIPGENKARPPLHSQTASTSSCEWFSFRELGDILRLAIPSVVQQSTVSIGMMLVQSVVNRFGADALAGYSATMRIENIFSSIFVSIGNAVSPFVSQNLGARKPERITPGYHAGLMLDVIFAAIAAAVIWLFARPIAGLFLGETGTPLAYQVAVDYMHWIGSFFIFMGIKMATDGVLRGLGRMTMFMVANLVNLGIRVFVAMVFAPQFGIGFVWYAVPLGWFANFAISYLTLRRIRSSRNGDSE